MEIAPEELKLILDSGRQVMIIDVREPAEHKICHLTGAKLIPLRDLPKRTTELNPKDFIVLYCHHGIRSAQATSWLKRNGFENVKNLRGGIDAWAEVIDPTMKRY